MKDGLILIVFISEKQVERESPMIATSGGEEGKQVLKCAVGDDIDRLLFSSV